MTELIADKTLDEILAEAGVNDAQALAIRDQLGVTEATDLKHVTPELLKGIGFLPVPAIKLVDQFQRYMPKASSVVAVLPDVPDDETCLESLKTGGVLKISPEAVVSAVRVYLLNRWGIFDIPDKLVLAMESHAQHLKITGETHVTYRGGLTGSGSVNN